ncbi:hypothetical protein BDN67DRAFT_1012737 [Paxillus ammoniavirescens]|nr:hypothetical protein BDN67DRAFT_1012737 [Paxillus ammoniavirescens]
MSNSIQTQSTVSSEAFEALIDLLASDGIEDDSAIPETRTRAQSNVTLRDSSGKLDFDKIRLMFAAQHESHGAADTTTTAPKPFSEDDARTERTLLATKSGRSMDSGDSGVGARARRSTSPLAITLSRSNSHSPQRATRRNTAYHRTSTFRDQLWSEIPADGVGSKVGTPPVLPYHPLSFNELSTALTSAHAEVNSLRQQYDELQALVSKRLGTGAWVQAGSSRNTTDTERIKPTGPLHKRDGHAEPRHLREDGSQTQHRVGSPPLPPSSDVPSEIGRLTGNEAKRVLTVLSRMLKLSPTALSSLTDPVSIPPTTPSRNQTTQHDIISITRALHFLDTVDELVWRRSLSSSESCNLQPTFSEENVAALITRLELWERAVRTPSRI